MLAHVYSCAVIGLEGVIIDIEVDYGQGMPHMAIVGLPDEAVKESRERVYSAIKNADLAVPCIAIENTGFSQPLAWGFQQAVIAVLETIVPLQEPKKNNKTHLVY